MKLFHPLDHILSYLKSILLYLFLLQVFLGPLYHLICLFNECPSHHTLIHRFNINLTLVFCNVLNDTHENWNDDQSQHEEYNRGEYLCPDLHE